MGFSYRKSFKAGPFRATVSKSGVSYSAGVKGARVTKRADGRVQTTLSAPGTGLRYTATSGSKGPRAAAVPAPGAQAAFAVTGRPIHFKGLRSSITLHPDRIEVKRSRLTADLSGHAVIPWADVVDVESVRPTIVGGSGYVRIVTRANPVLLAPPGRRNFIGAMADPTTVVFSNFPSGKRAHKALLAALGVA